jgi:hypothetical protein
LGDAGNGGEEDAHEAVLVDAEVDDLDHVFISHLI